MTFSTFSLLRCVLLLLFALSVAVPGWCQYQPQSGDKQKSSAPQISEGEREALGKIESAPDFAAKMKAAGDFVKKYPKSKVRGEVANRVAAKIAETPDAAQKITMCETYLTVFKEPAEADIINPILLEAYLKSEKFDEAFRLAASWLERNQNDVATLTEMALVGTDQAKRGNNKFIDPSQQYASKAVQLIESDQRGSLSEAQWGEYKTKWLSYLYQSMGILALVKNNGAEAKEKLLKASSLNSTDPFTWYLLAQITNTEYETSAKRFKEMPAGPARDDLLKQIHTMMDEVIDKYARTVALSSVDLQYKKLHDEVMQDLVTYYKYRHDGSTAGLQQLVDKYKKPSAPQ